MEGSPDNAVRHTKSTCLGETTPQHAQCRRLTTWIRLLSNVSEVETASHRLYPKGTTGES